MSVSVHIPSALRRDCGGAKEILVSAETVRAALEHIEQHHQALYRSVCDETGAVRRHVNLFINNHQLMRRKDIDTALEPGDVLFIMPAVSGG